MNHFIMAFAGRIVFKVNDSRNFILFIEEFEEND